MQGIRIGRHVNLYFLSGHIHLETVFMSFFVFILILLVQKLFENWFRFGPRELLFQFITDIAKTQETGFEWTALIGSIFVFVFVSNWTGSLLPWSIFEEIAPLGSPTNDINTTVALALIGSVSYFYAGLRALGFKNYFKKYFEPYPFLFPLKLLEDFTRPLSLSFRLFGNILADELVVAVILGLAPLGVPIPLILLGLFTSAIQALIFSRLTASYIGESKHAG